MKKLQDIASAIILAHILISGFDHLAHQRIDLTFALTENVVILSVITVSPLIAGALLYSRYKHAGAILLLSTMAVAFFFNLYHRFLTHHPSTHSPDFAHYWETIFLLSSALILITEVTGCWVGSKIIQLLGTSNEPPASNT